MFFPFSTHALSSRCMLFTAEFIKSRNQETRGLRLHADYILALGVGLEVDTKHKKMQDFRYCVIV